MKQRLKILGLALMVLMVGTFAFGNDVGVTNTEQPMVLNCTDELVVPVAQVTNGITAELVMPVGVNQQVNSSQTAQNLQSANFIKTNTAPQFPTQRVADVGVVQANEQVNTGANNFVDTGTFNSGFNNSFSFNADSSGTNEQTIGVDDFHDNVTAPMAMKQERIQPLTNATAMKRQF